MEKNHQKKHFSEEATLDKVENKIDHTMEKIMKNGIFTKILAHTYTKKILDSHFVHDSNEKIHVYLPTVFIIIGRISLITGIVGVFSFLISLSGLGFMFSLGFGIGIRVLMYVLLAILFSLLSLFTGIGMIRRKKRVISLVILGCMVSLVSFFLSFIPVGLYSYSAYGSFGGSFFNLLITFALLVLIVKNKDMFKN